MVLITLMTLLIVITQQNLHYFDIVHISKCRSAWRDGGGGRVEERMLLWVAAIEIKTQLLLITMNMMMLLSGAGR